MSTADLVVTAGGIGLIVWVNWYFFLAGRPAGRKAKQE